MFVRCILWGTASKSNNTSKSFRLLDRWCTDNTKYLLKRNLFAKIVDRPFNATQLSKLTTGCRTIQFLNPRYFLCTSTKISYLENLDDCNHQSTDNDRNRSWRYCTLAARIRTSNLCLLIQRGAHPGRWRFQRNSRFRISRGILLVENPKEIFWRTN